MLAQRTKLSVVTRLFLGVLLCTLGCVGGSALLSKLREGRSQAPVRSLRVTIEESQREELFDQLKKFADKHAFKFIISDYGTGGDLYLIEIRGDNIKILATITRADPKIVSIGFYRSLPENPPPDEKTVDDLLNDLKSFISEIPNVTIHE